MPATRAGRGGTHGVSARARRTAATCDPRGSDATSAAHRLPPTRPFDIDVAMSRLQAAVERLPKAAMFQLADEGFDSLFEQVVACIISIRTYEEVTLPTARKLFAVARTPAAMAQLTPDEIDALIGAATFHEPKSRQIHAIAMTALEQYDDALPADREVILSLPGVGPKCAALALGIACGQAGIGVDVHVHRVANRWGYIRARTPEATMLALEAILPRPYWLEINRLLVPFGKQVCTGAAPRCSTCPLADMCQKVGVSSHR